MLPWLSWCYEEMYAILNLRTKQLPFWATQPVKCPNHSDTAANEVSRAIKHPLAPN